MTTTVKSLEDALAYTNGEYTLHDILREAERGKLTIIKMPFVDAYAVYEIVKYPQKRYLHIILYSGELNDDVYFYFKDLAKALGLDGLSIAGRKGWLRKLRKHNPDAVYFHMVKDL